MPVAPLHRARFSGAILVRERRVEAIRGSPGLHGKRPADRIRILGGAT